MTESPRTCRGRATVAIELLKRARTEWVTRPALAKALGVKVERMGSKPEAAPGPAPMVYGLAAVWGGHA